MNKVFAVNNFLSYFNEYKLLTTVTGFQTQYLRYCILKSLRKTSSKNSQTGFLAHLLPIKLYLVILKKESAEMASTSTTRKHLNSVSIGNYEWIDNLKMDGVKRRICSSTLEIIEQGQVVHVLDFYLSFGNYTFLDEEDDDLKELKAFYVELKYVKGRLDKDISLK